MIKNSLNFVVLGTVIVNSIRSKEFFSKLIKAGCAIMLLLLMVGCKSQTIKTTSSIISTGNPTAPLVTIIPKAILDEKAQLIKSINQVLGSDVQKSERLIKIAYSVPEKGDITIAWSIEDKGDHKSTKVGAQNDAVNILKLLEQNNTRFIYVILSGNFLMQDEHGNLVEMEALNLGFNQSTLDRVNWKDFQSADIYDLADVRVIHPLFQ